MVANDLMVRKERIGAYISHKSIETEISKEPTEKVQTK